MADDKEKNDIENAVSAIEKNMFSLKFYPVAMDESTKDEAVKNLASIYKHGNETVKQLVLFMLHEAISQYYEFKIVHVYDYFKAKNPHEDQVQLRMNVYRAIFNYNTSLEGIIELIGLLGKLGENDDSAKLLTYHYARIASIETESHTGLKNAIIKALGECNSVYALSALITYAHYTDNERTLQRIQAALARWDKKIDRLRISEAKRKKLKSELKEVIIKETEKSPYR